jgi:hypothetical protein
MTFARHFLQNLSPGLIIQPQERHNRTPWCCAGIISDSRSCIGEGGGGGETGGTGAFNGSGDSKVESTTLARHLPQNLSPGFITFPQERHTRIPVWCGEDVPAPKSGITGGGGGGGTAAFTGTGDSKVESTTLARHLPQNLSPGFITFPQERHTRTPAGCDGCGAGGGIICG